MIGSMDAGQRCSGASNITTPKFFTSAHCLFRTPRKTPPLLTKPWHTAISMFVYVPKIDTNPLEKPASRAGRKLVRYAFERIPPGASGTFDRSLSTVKNALLAFLRTPEGQGMRFRYRPVTKHQTRVWRIK